MKKLLTTLLLIASLSTAQDDMAWFQLAAPRPSAGAPPPSWPQYGTPWWTPQFAATNSGTFVWTDDGNVFPAWQGCDRSIGSYYLSSDTAYPHYPRLDCGMATTVVTVAWWNYQDYAVTDFQLQSSDNATAWTTNLTATAVNTANILQAFTNPVPVSARFWRLACTTGVTVKYNAYYELDMSSAMLLPVMTNAVTTPYTITASSVYSAGYEGFRAFDRDKTTMYINNSTNVPFQLTIDLSTPRVCDRYTMWCRENTQFPSSCVFQASANGVDFTDLHSNTFPYVQASPQWIQATNTTAYRYYRMQVDSTYNSEGVGYCQIQEWRLFCFE